MKIAALCEAINEFRREYGAQEIQHVLVHTGEHYDANMSDFFFNDLELPKPDIFLDVGSGSDSIQTARLMERFENVLLSEKPDIVIVVGDMNSTVACALVTKKTLCDAANGGQSFIPKLVHIEAGLRSFDRSMPEEINRIVTDAVSDFLFTTEESANRNLLAERVPEHKIFFVGNVMIDTLLRYRSKANESSILNDLQLSNGAAVKTYGILTLHRPANVDDLSVFSRMLDAFLDISKQMPLIFPAHPRTLKQIHAADLGDYFIDHFVESPEPWDSRVRIRLIPPLGYLDFLRLMSHARLVLTDSGGIQEETTILGVPCITLRESTERPVTLEQGTNVLVGSSPEKIITEFNRIFQQEQERKNSPKYWDGNAAKRIVGVLAQQLLGNTGLSCDDG